ncbi:MAG: trans-sulfuration enzyme family protein [Paracoccaceae bacterium]|jgi:O-succinylhomoserine sulfhydrylase
MKNHPRNLMRPIGLPSSASRPVVTPLSPSVVYASEGPDMLDAQYEGRLQGYTYAREGHPNAEALARLIDDLEGAHHGIVLGSGMAAVSAALLGVLEAGDHIIGSDQLYGRSLRLLKEDLPRLGIDTSLVDTTQAECVAAARRPNTKMILIEAVSNPTLRVADLTGIAAWAAEKQVILAVDNTFTTPKAIRPFDFGADIVIHSVTKLLAGHSDVTLGYVAAKDQGLRDKIYTFSVTTGMTASPFDCWLAERGLLTFPLRFDKTQATASALAKMLAQHKAVARVLYPGQASHPDFTRAQTILGQNGCNMVSFELASQTREAAERFTKAADQIAFAPTLGDVGTTLSHPVSSSHRVLTGPEQQKLGISEGFFRVSVGLEDEIALLNVFEHALASV